MTLSVSGDSITFPDLSTQLTAPSGFGFKNRIINGDMRIDQRNAGASVTVGASDNYITDRWMLQSSQASKFSAQQNAGAVTPPAGFVNYLGATSLAATSVGAGDYFSIQQRIEGLNCSDLAWGSANAQSVTLSFWVRSSRTGAFGGSLRNNVGNRSYPFSYSISEANTWEYKTINIAGDTGGTWLTTNGIGITVTLGLGVGSTYSGTTGSWSSNNYVSATGATSVVGTSGATFYITGVQLEKGSTATAFDYRDYGRELSMCQRYFVGANTYYFTQGYDPNYSNINSGGVVWNYQMRTVPSITIISGGADGHHPIAPTVRSGPTYYGVGLSFSGAGLRTNANCSAFAAFSLSAEL
jgi:hypothetical protein